MIKNLILATVTAASVATTGLATTAPAKAHGWRGPYVAVVNAHPNCNCVWVKRWHNHHRVWVKICRWR